MKRCVLFIVMTGLLCLFGCDDEKEENKGKVEFPDTSEITQALFADDLTASVRIVTNNSWSSSVEEITRSGDAPTWIRLNPSSGGAGSYTLTVTLEENTTGEERAANITFFCDGDVQTIQITQKSTREDGTTPGTEEPETLSLVSQVIKGKNRWIFEYESGSTRISKILYEEQESSVLYKYEYSFSYPDDETISVICKEVTEGKDDLSENKIVVTLQNNRIITGHSTIDNLSWTTAYNDEGQLISTEWHNDEYIIQRIYKWEDNNMTIANWQWSAGENNVGYAIYNSGYENNKKVNLDFNWFAYSADGFWDALEFFDNKIFGYLGLYGERSQNMVAGNYNNKNNTSERETDWVYTYTTDSFSRITEILCSNHSTVYTGSHTITIEYK